MEGTSYKTIGEYIETLHEPVREKVQELYAFVKKRAPEASEKISWAMPTFYQNGNLVHFFAHKKHIGFYPGSSGIEYFAKEFDSMGLKYSKGAVQFSLDKPLPFELIGQIVDFRVVENTSRR